MSLAAGPVVDGLGGGRLIEIYRCQFSSEIMLVFSDECRFEYEVLADPHSVGQGKDDVFFSRQGAVQPGEGLIDGAPIEATGVEGVLQFLAVETGGTIRHHSEGGGGAKGREEDIGVGLGGHDLLHEVEGELVVGGDETGLVRRAGGKDGRTDRTGEDDGKQLPGNLEGALEAHISGFSSVAD